MFQNLAVQKLTEESDRMLVAPLRFKSVLLEEMDRVIAAAHMGRPASMILKNNSISDRDIILKLQEASRAGVRIDMIVRGICCVRAGVPGKTENLHIRSLVEAYGIFLCGKLSYDLCTVDIVNLATLFLDIAVKEILQRADSEL